MNVFFFHHVLKHRIIGLLGNQVIYKHIYICIILSRIALISITKAKLTKKNKSHAYLVSTLASSSPQPSRISFGMRMKTTLSIKEAVARPTAKYAAL